MSELDLKQTKLRSLIPNRPFPWDWGMRCLNTLARLALLCSRSPVSPSLCMPGCSVVIRSLRPRELKPISLLCSWNIPPRMLGWVAISSSRWSSAPKDWTCISCVSFIADGFITRWAVREAPFTLMSFYTFLFSLPSLAYPLQC